MGYRNLQQCVADLQRHGHLVELQDPIDARLEVAEVQRRVYKSQGPAVLFTQVKDCSFPMVSNLFGTIERSRFMFRDTLESLKRLVELKIDPTLFWKSPRRFLGPVLSARRMRPKRRRRGPVMANQTSIDRLPALQSWPDDGGPFITLPQVYSEDCRHPGWKRSNLGMYRVQLSGGDYAANDEIGLHYQIHRGIGVHHKAAIENEKPFPVNIFVGGTPAMTLSAVMPLPEGMSELTFAGVLAGHRIPLAMGDDLPLYGEADFCITGTVIEGKKLPEGPFGDHLGYYSLAHDFPVLRVHKVFHRNEAIWPFTVVGRPPQEDTSFGQLIHEITGPAIPSVLPGVEAVHAVDAAGVHPLLLAIGSERYTPYQQLHRPQELLRQAHAILGQGQLSLAKYLLIADRDDTKDVDIHDVARFLQHILARADWKRDLHFHTRTTIDTLDYSGDGVNEGSKLVIAAAGRPRYELCRQIPAELQLPEGFSQPRVAQPGILVVTGPPCRTTAREQRQADLRRFCQAFDPEEKVNQFRWIVIVDDSDFAARDIDNFTWVVFTRSNPASDVSGIGEFVEDKHWGCRGALVIDARIKPQHAPPLVESPDVTRRIDALAARGGPLSKYL